MPEGPHPRPPSAPPKVTVPADHPHHEVWSRTREALTALPAYFSTETVLSGIRATDIFTLNDALGATIEDQVVSTLNKMRPLWDPEDAYRLYWFIRRPQTFPDVLLAKRNVRTADVEDIAFGIELKGWYLLAKEGEPSFRYRVTPGACADLDLLVVVPWFLSNVVAGTPKVLTPFIESAKYAALYRNYHWQHLRETDEPRSINAPLAPKPYPKKADQVADRPESDNGDNFGRFARTGIMDEYMTAMQEELLVGIPAKYWRRFFKMFQEAEEPDRIARAFAAAEADIKRERAAEPEKARKSRGRGRA